MYERIGLSRNNSINNVKFDVSALYLAIHPTPAQHCTMLRRMILWSSGSVRVR